MPKKTIVDAINAQISREFNAAYLYLSMSAHFESQNLAGFARWFRLQHEEEMGHAMRLFDFLYDIGGSVRLQAIKKPAGTWSSAKAVMQDALKHEKGVSKTVNELYALAVREKDYPTQVHLQWFVNEQVEEEKTLGDILAKMKLAGDSGHALLLMDRELGARANG
jgi:ferritin